MQEIIADIEHTLLHWDKVRATAGDFGARAFLIRKKEFGHIHPNGDLDIMFGPSITTELLRTGLVQRHEYVPASGVTYRIRRKEHIPFALALLGFSYRLTASKAAGLPLDLPSLVNGELATLQTVHRA